MKTQCQASPARTLTQDQKEVWASICADLLHEAQNDATFISSIIAKDESWCFQYNPQTKRQSAEWRSTGTPPSKKVRQQPLKTKTMIIVFYNARGMVHHEFVPQGQTVNQEVYISILRRMREALRRRRPDLWASGQWTLLHENARPHTALSVSRFLTKHKVTVLPHPPYSPDRSPCDFFCFHVWKKRLKGRRHENIEAIQAAVTMELTGIQKEAFTSCFQDLQKRWQQCIDCGGNYFEGDRKH